MADGGPTPVLVSVVVPVHNGARFIDDALDSVEDQVGAPPLEVIVVDDGSDDGTADRVERRGDRVTVLRQDQRGPAAARNTGIARAHGTHVAFLDADDRWTPDKVGLQLAHLDADPSIDVVLGRQRFVLDGIDELPAWVTAPSPWMPFALRDQPRAQVPLSTMLARREAFEQIGPFDEELRHAEDLDWVIRAIDAGLTVEPLGDVVLERRVHADNASTDEHAMQQGVLAALGRRARRRRPSGPPSDPAGSTTVAVVIASRDHGPLITEAIASVHAQSRPVDELIVIDDGSQDDTTAIVRMAAPSARVVRQPPSGASSARNLGASMARSSHVLFLDADDRLAPLAIEQLVATLQDAAAQDGSPDRAADATARAALGRTTEFVDGEDARLRAPQDDAVVRLLGAMLLPTSLFRAIGGLDESLPRGEAIDLQHRASHAGMRILVTDAVVLERRLHGANGGLTELDGSTDYLAVARRAVLRSRAAGGS